MKQSKFFIPTLRETPKDAQIASHRILLKGGYIKQVAAGIYDYLPLAYKIIKKIENIVREEINKTEAVEVLMPALQPKDLWVESGRWEKYGKELMRLEDRNERSFCLGPTHEEVITAMVRDYVNSYKKLSIGLYQIQTKFRDEFRPRFGLMRGREFLMFDLYTFHKDEEDLDVWYKKVREAYKRILERLSLDYRIIGAGSGNIGGNASEEFMVLCDIGEDTIVYSDSSSFALNQEICDLKEGDPSPDGKGVIKYAKGIEVGHIFKLGTTYSELMKATFIDQDQQTKPIVMGCYGIGISRLLMAILEQHSTDEKPIWPKEVTPFDLHIIPLGDNLEQGLKVYEKLSKEYDCLIDDRDERAGVKFQDADLIGVRYRIVVGRKASEGIYEFQDLLKGEKKELKLAEIEKELKK
ncbi:MAG TPA: proline--tRNA ligase [Acholeplasma sp.]|nr:proline--tRNA ligase [Acholeplasma sp.]